MGIVYHTNYIRWFEMGRTELFRDLGISGRELEKEGLQLPLTKVFCHYLLPVRYDDLVEVETEIAYLKRASIKFNYRIWDEQRRNLLTEGYSIHACIDRDGRIVKIPSTIATMIRDPYDHFGGEEEKP